MIGLIALLISCSLGYYVLRCFKERDCSLGLLDLFLIIGLGLGISAQIVFYALIFSGHFDSVLIIQIHLICLCGLFICSRRYLSQQTLISSLSFRSFSIVFVILLMVGLMATILALIRPWGDWDGLSFWNYRASFFFRSGYGWPHMFEFNMQQHHPWMLPLIILWGWSFYASEQTIIPVGIGIIFTVSTIGLVIGALNKYVSFFWALLGGIFLASIPIYVTHGTSQYADILAAFFILLSSVLALDLLKFPSFNNAVLTGLCLGLTASVKDNSIVAALLLMFLIVVRLYKSQSKILIRPLCWGFITIGVSVVLMRSFEAFYANNNPYSVFWPGLWDWQKWVLIGQFVLGTFIDFSWGGLWALVLALLIVQPASWIKGEIGFLVQFIFLYIIFYFFIFAASASGLEWLLSVSFDRLLYLLAPAVVFVMFYTVGEKR